MPGASEQTRPVKIVNANWDPADRTLIAANLVGKMPWTERA
jgi:hypothetical protein